LNPEDGNDRLSQNVGKELPLLIASPEERGSQLLRGGSLKSHIPKTHLFCYHCSVSTLFSLEYVGDS